MTGIAGYVARDMRGATPGQLATKLATTSPGPLPAVITPTRPKVEYFNLAELTNTDARGFVRSVERFHVEPWGLYMARTVGGPQFHYVESWLIPELSIRATITHRNASHHREQDFCLDIGEFAKVEPKRWKAIDHYLDIMVQGGRKSELRGVEDLLAAHAAGLVDTAQAHRAFDRAAAAMDGLAVHDHDVARWLGSHGIILSWM
jgi:predicted RNA-binding protein associated with RNAse of E/G family